MLFDVEKIPLKFRRDIATATDLLKREGCESVYLFGSLVTGTFHDGSDIDLGIKGLPPEKFFHVGGKLMFSVDREIDLVDFDWQTDFYQLLVRIGEVVKIG